MGIINKLINRILSLSAAVMTMISCSVPAYVSADEPEPERVSDEMEKALKFAVDTAEDDIHGYSMFNRNGPDYDCASLIAYSLKHAGVYQDFIFTTSKMYGALDGKGFYYIPWECIGDASNLQRGDILYMDGHVEFYLGGYRNVGAHHDYGSPASGDQSGNEISVTYYYDGWEGVFRFGETYKDAVTRGKTFPKCPSSCQTLSCGLRHIAVSDSESNISEIAQANGISGYDGRDEHKNQLLSLLKAGELKKVWYRSLPLLDSYGYEFDSSIVSAASGLPLSIDENENTVSGDDSGSTSEMWHFVPADDGSYRIVNFRNGKSLDANASGNEPGTNVSSYDSHDGDNQRWYIYRTENGYYSLRPKYTSLILDSGESQDQAGSNAVLNSCSDSLSQEFVISGYYSYPPEAEPVPSRPVSFINDDGSVTVSWKKSRYTDSYKLYRSYDLENWEIISDTEDTVFTDKEADTEKTCYYKTESINRYYEIRSEYDDAVRKVPGDINLNGETDGTDCIRLIQYLTGQNTYLSEKAEITADINSNGSIDLFDLIRLHRIVISSEKL